MSLWPDGTLMKNEDRLEALAPVGGMGLVDVVDHDVERRERALADRLVALGDNEMGAPRSSKTPKRSLRKMLRMPIDLKKSMVFATAWVSRWTWPIATGGRASRFAGLGTADFFVAAAIGSSRYR